MIQPTQIQPAAARHQITRIRHETRRRILTVVARQMLTPRMLRLHFTGTDLDGFVSAGADDHIKLFFPDVPGADAAKPCMRDYTPRAFDVAQGRLAIDFALHEAGPATSWASQAGIGDQLEIGGPRGSMVVPDDFDWYLLVGDETALPAIGRRVEELRAGVPVTTAVIVQDAGEIQALETRADWTPLWVLREAASAGDGAALQAALAGHPFPPGEGFVWIAGETSMARAVRRYLVEARGHPAIWLKAAGYWKQGEADAHEKIEE